MKKVDNDKEWIVSLFIHDQFSSKGMCCKKQCFGEDLPFWLEELKMLSINSTNILLDRFQEMMVAMRRSNSSCRNPSEIYR
jgi:hypothetical protein